MSSLVFLRSSLVVVQYSLVLSTTGRCFCFWSLYYIAGILLNACTDGDEHIKQVSYPEAAEGKEKWEVKEKALMASAGARAYNEGCR